MVLHQLLDRSRNEGTDLYSVCFEDRAYDMPEGIAKTADYSHRIVGGIILLQTSVHKSLNIAVDKLLDVGM